MTNGSYENKTFWKKSLRLYWFKSSLEKEKNPKLIIVLTYFSTFIYFAHLMVFFSLNRFRFFFHKIGKNKKIVSVTKRENASSHFTISIRYKNKHFANFLFEKQTTRLFGCNNRIKQLKSSTESLGKKIATLFFEVIN